MNDQVGNYLNVDSAEPLGYQAVVRGFSRRCQRLGIREPWLTPHAFRHSHATEMWDGGMREMTLQKRLGHASPDSTAIYTNPQKLHQTGLPSADLRGLAA